MTEEKRAIKTLEDIERLDKSMLRAEDVATFIGINPHEIRRQAREEPAKLGFPAIVTGTSVRIPKEGFLFFCRFGHSVPGKAKDGDECA